jgi:hypothetical protein
MGQDMTSPARLLLLLLALSLRIPAFWTLPAAGPALRVDITDGGTNTDRFEIKYKDLRRWQEIVREYLLSGNRSNWVDQGTLVEHIKSQLTQRGYPGSIVNYECPNETVTASAPQDPYAFVDANRFTTTARDAVARLYSTAISMVYPLGVGSLSVFAATGRGTYVNNPVADIRDIATTTTTTTTYSYRPLLPDRLRRSKVGVSAVLIYQTRGAHTGGTVALKMLFEMISRAGIDAVLCDGEPNMPAICRHPSGKQFSIEKDIDEGPMDDQYLRTHTHTHENTHTHTHTRIHDICSRQRFGYHR